MGLARTRGTCNDVAGEQECLWGDLGGEARAECAVGVAGEQEEVKTANARPCIP